MTAFYQEQALDSLYISVVSIAEIRFGIELQEDVTRCAELNEWLTLTLWPAFAGRILPVTADILKWRTVDGRWAKTGHTYSPPDPALAAIALYFGLTVVARPERFRQGSSARVQPVGVVSGAQDTPIASLARFERHPDHPGKGGSLTTSRIPAKELAADLGEDWSEPRGRAGRRCS